MRLLVLFAAIVLVWLGWLGFLRLRARRRQAISKQPLIKPWLEILDRNVALHARLPDDLKRQLHGHIQLFLHDKRFYGFEGLEVNDEMRVTVAGNACILLLNRPHDHFSGFRSIYLYPATFTSRHTSYDGLVESVGRQARLGESWHRGPVVLAWDAVLHGTLDIKDGHNVVLHEFAHKLDGADGRVDGAPILGQSSNYISYARVMQREYKRLQRQAGHGARTVMDHYGASAPEEFFAVLVETFFEKPRQLNKKHPELYAEMKNCFRVDPVEWQSP